jgi:hypothetical protein
MVDLGRDSFLATAGISAQFGRRWNGNFYYTADFGKQSFISHMISAGLEWNFKRCLVPAR